jgi:hypothetical protein
LIIRRAAQAPPIIDASKKQIEYLLFAICYLLLQRGGSRRAVSGCEKMLATVYFE